MNTSINYVLRLHLSNLCTPTCHQHLAIIVPLEQTKIFTTVCHQTLQTTHIDGNNNRCNCNNLSLHNLLPSLHLSLHQLVRPTAPKITGAEPYGINFILLTQISRLYFRLCLTVLLTTFLGPADHHLLIFMLGEVQSMSSWQ